ncbi:hypothetical protein NHX12_034425 [Muraenolepis orangiensis]|uniref:Uncharacterized protein n=1 Tax=Muraenolepis orangiensis TaxID=630683 RepID=A0A9Q0D8S2_9TELE|nr:hypothetical protein NHX12_034425 [Muraenolepis orangiensis]
MDPTRVARGEDLGEAIDLVLFAPLTGTGSGATADLCGPGTGPVLTKCIVGSDGAAWSVQSHREPSDLVII